MNIDFGYLSSIADQIPVTGVRWGCSFDGQRLALVGYAICSNGAHVPMRDRVGSFVADKSPMVFFAASLTNCSMSRAVRAFDQIADATNLMGLALVFRGALGRNEVFVRHLKTNGGLHSPMLFSSGQGRYYDETEVLAAVADDQEEALIRLAPEFEGRPERVMLDEEVGLIDLGRKLSPLQEAFIYGLGEWSCKERRRKYMVGPTNIKVY